MSFSICDKLAIFSIDLDNITRLTKKKRIRICSSHHEPPFAYPSYCPARYHLLTNSASLSDGTLLVR